MSESAVKTVKRLVKRALLAREDAHLSSGFRNTRTQGMTTSATESDRENAKPSDQTRPMSEKLLKPKLNHNIPQRSIVKDWQIKYYRAKAKDLPSLTTGQTVMIEPGRKGQLCCKATVQDWPK